MNLTLLYEHVIACHARHASAQIPILESSRQVALTGTISAWRVLLERGDFARYPELEKRILQQMKNVAGTATASTLSISCARWEAAHVLDQADTTSTYIVREGK